MKQLTNIYNYIERVEPKLYGKVPFIILGDFNTPSNGVACQIAKNGVEAFDSSDIASHFKSNELIAMKEKKNMVLFRSTYCDATKQILKHSKKNDPNEPFPTFCSSHVRGNNNFNSGAYRIDHILYNSSSLRLIAVKETVNSEIIQAIEKNGIVTAMGSDHIAVAAILEIIPTTNTSTTSTGETKSNNSTSSIASSSSSLTSLTSAERWELEQLLWRAPCRKLSKHSKHVKQSPTTQQSIRKHKDLVQQFISNLVPKSKRKWSKKRVKQWRKRNWSTRMSTAVPCETLPLAPLALRRELSREGIRLLLQGVGASAKGIPPPSLRRIVSDEGVVKGVVKKRVPRLRMKSSTN